MALLPDDAIDPGSVRYAAVWKPKPGMLGDFPKLEAIFNLGAGVDAVVADLTLPQVPLVPTGGVVADPGLYGFEGGAGDFYLLTFNNGENRGHVHWIAGAGLGKTVHAQWTGVGYQDNLSTFEHEDAGTFRKFAVEANHGSNLRDTCYGR